jgi:copper oxidase (laccase) domain-containing protein
LEITIGPHICQKHYEVKNDVSSKFVKFPGAILRKDGKEFLDLAKIAEFQLIESGIKKENIKTDKTCNFEDLSLPSYRRSKTSRRLIIKLSLT